MRAASCSKSCDNDDSLLYKALTSADVNNNVEEEFTVFIPMSSKRTFNERTNCKACGATFECSKYKFNVIYSEDYYVHCATKCDEYKKLGKVKREKGD